MDSLKQLILQKKQERQAKVAKTSPVPLQHPQIPSPKVPVPLLQTIPLTLSEIVFRLRKLKQPAILFGESLSDQYSRLKSSEVKLIEEGKSQNTQHLDLDKLEETLEGDRSLYYASEFIDQGKDCQNCEDQGLVWKKEKWQHPFIIEAKSTAYGQKTLIVFMWWKEILTLWKENLNKDDKVLYYKTLSAFDKLVSALKAQAISEEIVDLYFATVRFCQIKSYIRAHDMYLKLSAANVFENTKALKKIPDQNYRKYTQTFKRVLTVAQRLLPDDPSRTVSI